MNLRDTIVQALQDEAEYFGGTGNPQHDLANQVLTRLAMRIEAGSLTENEISVVVPPGGTLVLRLDPKINQGAYDDYRGALAEELSGAADPGFKILVVVADQLGVCSEDHGPGLDHNTVR
jgi:hypothetical protein